MEDKKIEKYIEGDLILKDKNKEVDTKIKIPKEIFSGVIKSLQEHEKVIETKETVEEIKKSTKNLYEITMRPDLKEGIDCGDYIWKDCALEIRDGETGKYVGKAQIKKSDDRDIKEIRNTITKENKPTLISNVTKTICSISGQVQLAEISEKIDLLNDKVDEIKGLLIDKEVCNLKECIETIEKDSKLLPENNAINRISDSIRDLRKLSKFFEGEVNKIINKKVKYSVKDSFYDGCRGILDFLINDVKEYNNKYINEIKEILNQYSFLVDCYFKSLVSLGICYQILYGYNEAREYYEKANSEVNKLMLDISNKLVYLLDIKDVSINECIDIGTILESLSGRRVMLQEELKNANFYMKNINKEYELLTQQFNNVEIKLLISDDELFNEGEK